MGLNPAMSEMLVSDLGTSISDWSAVLEFKRQVVVGTPGTPVQSADLTEEGALGVADLIWVGRISDFPRKLPEPRDAVKVDGVNYWVVTAEPDGLAITLELRKGPQ